MGKNGVKIVAGVGGAFLLIILCFALAAGSYLLGRRSASAPPPAVAVERVETAADPSPALEATVPLELAVPTEPPAPAVPAPMADEAPPAETVPNPAPARPPAQSQIERDGEFAGSDLDLLWEVWEIVQREFDGELPDEQELAYGVIRGLLASLGDAHTRFVDPDAAARMQERFEGAYQGIGAYIQTNDDGFAEIVRPISGSPAEAAGVRPGDIVVAVDGEPMLDRSLNEIVSYILGPAGTEVTITFVRGDEADPFDVTITRAHIEVPVVVHEMLDDGIAYVELVNFNSLATERLQAALEELLARNPRGLILDLRNNTGGFLSQSVTVADLFLPEGVVVYERSTLGGIDDVFRSGDGQIAEQIPLVVLVNEFSASAAEIVAGAIRDHDRGVLIGETTFGKGSVQMPHTLSDGSQLYVTIARWYTPDNISIDAEGIVPDIEVELDERVPLESRDDDVQLQRAIEFLLVGE